MLLPASPHPAEELTLYNTLHSVLPGVVLAAQVVVVVVVVVSNSKGNFLGYYRFRTQKVIHRFFD